MSNKVGKTLFGHAYNDNPVSFKKDFKILLKDKIVSRINDKKQEIVKSINTKSEKSDNAEE